MTKTVDEKRCYLSISQSEIAKFFSKSPDKSFSIYQLISQVKGLQDTFNKKPVINIKGVFHLHPMHKTKWLLDKIYYSIPCFEFNAYEDNLTRSYFRDTTSFNGNLRFQQTTDFNNTELSPMVMFDVDVGIYSITVEDLFKQKEIAYDVCIDRFELKFEFTEADKYNRFLKHKYGNDIKWYFTNPKYCHMVFDIANLAATNCDMLDTEDIEHFPMACWKNLKCLKPLPNGKNCIENLLETSLFITKISK